MSIWIWALIVAIVAYLVYVYNKLIVLRNRIKNAWRQIDVLLQRRANLIPNLVETVKGYAKHENQTFIAIAQARSALLNAKTTAEKAKANNMLSSTLKTLFAVSENYPELKANQNFMQLQEQLVDTENKVSYARQFYNDTVMQFNNFLLVFPANMIGSTFHFQPAEYFKVEDKSVRTNPKVKF